MIAYPDTSFLCGFYVRQSNSPAAAAYAAKMKEPLYLTELLRYEFLQSLRFQVWRRTAHPREGMTQADADTAAHRFESDLVDGIAVIVPCDLMAVLRRANEISRRHTKEAGYRSFDILHVATALELGAKEFLSFDVKQRELAEAESLDVKP